MGYWLAMSNCAVNPIIYYWMSHRFREHFNKLLICKSSYEEPFLTFVDPQPSPALSMNSRRSYSVYISRSNTTSQADSPYHVRAGRPLRQTSLSGQWVGARA